MNYTNFCVGIVGIWKGRGKGIGDWTSHFVRSVV